MDDKIPTSLLRELRGDPAGFGRDFWRQGADLGWTSLLVPEADGGGSVSGQGLADLALVAFEFGRYAAPGPLTTVNVVTAAVARSGTAAQQAELLPGLMTGARIGSWACAEPRPFGRLGAVGVTARKSNGQYLLTGVKAPVEAAGQADLFLVTAAGQDGGLLQFLVPAGTPWVSVRPMRSLDITRRYGRVGFGDAAVPASALLGEPGTAAADVERQLQIALVIQLKGGERGVYRLAEAAADADAVPVRLRRTVVLFLHVIAVIIVFASLTVDWLAVSGLRGTWTAEQGRLWVRALEVSAAFGSG